MGLRQDCHHVEWVDGLFAQQTEIAVDGELEGALLAGHFGRVAEIPGRLEHQTEKLPAGIAQSITNPFVNDTVRIDQRRGVGWQAALKCLNHHILHLVVVEVICNDSQIGMIGGRGILDQRPNRRRQRGIIQQLIELRQPGSGSVRWICGGAAIRRCDRPDDYKEYEPTGYPRSSHGRHPFPRPCFIRP